MTSKRPYPAEGPPRLLLLLVLLLLQVATSTITTQQQHHHPQVYPIPSSSTLLFGISRGGGSGRATRSSTTKSLSSSSSDSSTIFGVLARAVEGKLIDNDTDRAQITKALSKLASAQQAFKGLDGVAHEAYQRTHAGDDIDAAVAGRAQRSAARLGATAEALLACELIECVKFPDLVIVDHNNDVSSSSTSSSIEDEVVGDCLTHRHVILNISSTTNTSIPLGTTGTHLSVLVLYEESYDGGVGLEHGNIVHLSDTTNNPQQQRRRPPRGRLLVILSDSLSNDLVETLKLLDQTPQRVKLSSGLVMNEVVSVQPALYKTAGNLLQILDPLLRSYKNTTSIHFVGQSLAGGVASLAATILDGSLPLPKNSKSKSKSKSSKSKSSHKQKRQGGTHHKGSRSSKDDIEASSTPPTTTSSEDVFSTTTENSPHTATDPLTTAGNETDTDAIVVPLEPLNGLGRARSSALSLGAPPCLSSNVVAAFCTSFMYGDDIVCRTTPDSMSRLVARVDKKLHGGLVGRNLGWMTDTLSLTVSSLKTHAHGSEGEEIKLAIPGRAYLLRPRRLGGICSIHEVGTLNKGGREALRAGLLWQLNDILLSKSLWKHHQLESYIQGLDRVQLRGIGDEDDDDEEYHDGSYPQ